ncbi:MAG: flagellar hook assembly protein FlgD [Thiobacillaceae bacterium]
MAVSAVQHDNASLFAALNGAAGEQGRSGLKAVEDRFLKLLVTQLRNQDPMNPMENAELTMQLAQMSTVEGINKLNAGLETLMDSYRASQTLQAAGLIGHQVFVAGDRLDLSAEGMAIGGLDLAQAAAKVRVDILDAGGAVVRTLDLGPLPAGLSRFVWDGLDDAGAMLPTGGDYRFVVEAQADGQPVKAVTLTLDQVYGVITEGTGMALELAHRGRLTLDKVRQIF